MFLPVGGVVPEISEVLIDGDGEDTACNNHRNTNSWNIHCNLLVGIVGGVFGVIEQSPTVAIATETNHRQHMI